MPKDLFLVSHETKTAVHIGKNNSGIPNVMPGKIAALNAFLTVNLGNAVIPVWDDDDEFEEILDIYTFITTEDAEKSIYKKGQF